MPSLDLSGNQEQHEIASLSDISLDATSISSSRASCAAVAATGSLDSDFSAATSSQATDVLFAMGNFCARQSCKFLDQSE